MKIILTTILTVALGVAGILFFFGDRESIAQLILSKPIGLLMLYASYRLYKSLYREIQSTISNN